MKGLGGSDELAKTELEALDNKLDAYNVILGRQKYLAGDVRTTNLFPKNADADLPVEADACRPVPHPLRLDAGKGWVQRAGGEAECRALVEGHYVARVVAGGQGRRQGNCVGNYWEPEGL